MFIIILLPFYNHLHVLIFCSKKRFYFINRKEQPLTFSPKIL